AALAPRYLAWLAYENAHGMNIYVAANPLRSGSRKRTKESIASVRHLYLDIDTDGDAKLASLRASDALPEPSAILATSPGKYQVLWQVEGFDFVLQEAMLKQLAIAYGGDPACTDRNRVLRVPGFGNCKYRPVHEVAVEYPSASVCTHGDFHLDASQTNGMLLRHKVHRHKPPSKHSESEGDWAWVCGELMRGTDAMKLTQDLTSRRSDKPNPLYYAQRTVDMASARLWLLDGVPTDDIITMLQFRRRFELPAALCSARSREIAETAQRMIARRKIA
ncbi:MAG TPA: DNA-primase RepB domain-containing protein, partial [Acidobacteriaceae bacterium]